MVYLSINQILRKFQIRKIDRFSGSAVVIVMPNLIFCFPFAKAPHEHAENGFFRPEPMLLSGLEQEFLVGFGVKELPIDFQSRSVVQKMKELMPDGMGMKACPFTGFHLGKIDTARLVAHHHTDVPPGSFGMNGLLAFARVGHRTVL